MKTKVKASGNPTTAKTKPVQPPKIKKNPTAAPTPVPLSWWRKQDKKTQTGVLVGAVGGSIVVYTAVIIVAMLLAKTATVTK